MSKLICDNNLSNIFDIMGEEQKSKFAKCPLVFKIINIISALLLIGFGLAGLILQTINNLTSGKFFLLFSPILMILIGLLFLGGEFRIKIILKNFQFMSSYLGRGVFNLFMASIVFYFFSCGNSNDIVGWIAAILIFLLGIFYIGIHFCGGEQFKIKDEQASTTSKGMKEQLN